MNDKNLISRAVKYCEDITDEVKTRMTPIENQLVELSKRFDAIERLLKLRPEPWIAFSSPRHAGKSWVHDAVMEAQEKPKRDGSRPLNCSDCEYKVNGYSSCLHNPQANYSCHSSLQKEPTHKAGEKCELPIGNDWWGEAQRFDFYRTNETRDVNPGEWAVNPEGKIWFYLEGYPNKREILRAVLREVKPARKPEVGKLAFYKSIVRVLNIGGDVVQIEDLISPNRFSTYCYCLREVKPDDWSVEIAPGVKVSARECSNGDIVVLVNGIDSVEFHKDDPEIPDDLAAGLALLKASGVPVKPYTP